MQRNVTAYKMSKSSESKSEKSCRSGESVDNIKALVVELPLLLKYDGSDPDYVQRRLEQAADALAPLAEPVEIPPEPQTFKMYRGKELIEEHVVTLVAYDRLRAALERALADARHVRQANENYREENRLATARAEAGERDAGRYRRLRPYLFIDSSGVLQVSNHFPHFEPEGHRVTIEVDAALDAAGKESHD